MLDLVCGPNLFLTMQGLKMKNSATINLFKTWKLDPKVANLLAPTCFNDLTKMTTFQCNNILLRSAMKKMKDGKFKFGRYSLYLGLQDIYNITGLPVDGEPIVCDNLNPGELITKMLGEDDPKRTGNHFCVSKNLLKSTFEIVPGDINGKDLLRYARAYLLFLMATILFPDNQKPGIFVGYLLFLEDLKAVNSYAWGTAVLAQLQAGFQKSTCSRGAGWILEVCV